MSGRRGGLARADAQGFDYRKTFRVLVSRGGGVLYGNSPHNILSSLPSQTPRLFSIFSSLEDPLCLHPSWIPTLIEALPQTAATKGLITVDCGTSEHAGRGRCSRPGPCWEV